jgi:hypothetical protein
MKVKDINGGTFGHAVNVVGYYIAKNKNTNSKSYYLIVADGWTTNLKYLKFPCKYIYYAYGIEFVF